MLSYWRQTLDHHRSDLYPNIFNHLVFILVRLINWRIWKEKCLKAYKVLQGVGENHGEARHHSGRKQERWVRISVREGDLVFTISSSATSRDKMNCLLCPSRYLIWQKTLKIYCRVMNPVYVYQLVTDFISVHILYRAPFPSPDCISFLWKWFWGDSIIEVIDVYYLFIFFFFSHNFAPVFFFVCVIVGGSTGPFVPVFSLSLGPSADFPKLLSIV